MELRRNGTINTHSFSHPWSADNIKKRGGRMAGYMQGEEG